jgi:RNA 3'-terminal phosphate cyclase (ATP)
MSNIRATRSRPGLLRQHLTAVQSATQVGNAEVSGAELGASELLFRPQSPSVPPGARMLGWARVHPRRP